MLNQYIYNDDHRNFIVLTREPVARLESAHYCNHKVADDQFMLSIKNKQQEKGKTNFISLRMTACSCLLC